MTKKQAEYKKLYDAGHSMAEIAKITGKNISTVSRTLKKVAESHSMSRWISIEERLPPFHTDLLVVSDGKVYAAKEMLTWEDGHSTVYIPAFGKWRRYTHWMFMPEPPEIGGETDA